MEYSEEDYLLISGIQHFSFCRRQWALIHIEEQWHENLLTTEGKIIHEHCHDVKFIEKRGDMLIVRGLRVSSRFLGVTGQCDVVEFKRDENGCILHGHRGRWTAYPVEYKHGKVKSIAADRLQLCTQAMCLEEMLSCKITKGALYYAELHRREEVIFSEEMRQFVKKMLVEMHTYAQKGYTPKVKPQKGCRSCSLKDICLPVLLKVKSVKSYYDSFLNGD